jgi:hypothetical protein
VVLIVAVVFLLLAAFFGWIAVRKVIEWLK